MPIPGENIGSWRFSIGRCWPWSLLQALPQAAELQKALQFEASRSGMEAANSAGCIAKPWTPGGVKPGATGE